MAVDFSTPELWNAVEPLARLQVYEKGASLFEQGTQAKGVYMVLKGELRVWMPEETGPAAVTTAAGPGTMLGLSEAICDGTHKLSATAVARTEIGFVERRVLMEFLESHHEVCMQVVRLLSDDLHALYHRFQRLKVTGPRHRRTGTDRNVQ